MAKKGYWKLIKWHDHITKLTWNKNLKIHCKKKIIICYYYTADLKCLVESVEIFQLTLKLTEHFKLTKLKMYLHKYIYIVFLQCESSFKW